MECEVIEDLRKKLHQLISEYADFEEIQKVSQLLDQCIVEYYSDKLKKKDNTT